MNINSFSPIIQGVFSMNTKDMDIKDQKEFLIAGTSFLAFDCFTKTTNSKSKVKSK